VFGYGEEQAYQVLTIVVFICQLFIALIYRRLPFFVAASFVATSC